MYGRTAMALGLLMPGLALAGGFKASSSQKDAKNPGIWDAASALDGNLETCWKVDPEADNVGQFIEVMVPASTVDKIGLVVGWDKSEDSFKDYPRIKAAKIEILQGGAKIAESVVQAADQRGWRILDVPDTKLEGAGGVVRVTIQEVWPGADFPNLAVSEVRVHLAEFPAGTIKVLEPAAGGEALIDGNPKTVWNGTTDTPLLFTASGYGLASIGVQAGPTGHPKTIEITANDSTMRVEMADKPEMQYFLLPVLVGYTGSSWGRIGLKIIDTYGGAPTLSEVVLTGATIEEF